MLVKNAGALERLTHATTLLVDKTGTLTEGRPRVVGVQPAAGFNETEVLTLAAAVESASEHPLARAIVAAARERGFRVVAIRPDSLTDLEAALRFASDRHLPEFVLGGGSNVLIGDLGIRGLVIRPQGGSIDLRDQTRVRADAAVTRFIAPGPDVARHTPGRPVARANPCAACACSPPSRRFSAFPL